MGTTKLIAVLVAALLIMLFLVMKWKINAALALLISAIVMGIGAGLPLADLAAGLGTGFGNFMSGTGLPIGLGIILGQILYDYGGAHRIANTFINSFSDKKVFYALAFAAFVISIPVFFDVTFILLAPLGIAIAQELHIPNYKVCIALLAGAVFTHTCVPPTPGPLSAAGIMGVDVGMMIIAGSVIGLVAVIVTMKIMDAIFARNFWNPETDEVGSMGSQTAEAPLIDDASKAPGFVVSMIPIFVPVILLLINTVWGALSETTPLVVQFLGNKTISMLMGVIASMIIGKAHLSWEQLSASCNNSLTQAGTVLMITGAGAAFGQILSLAGISAAITAGISSMNAGVVGMILVTYLIATVIRVAQGSATVACITSVTLLAETVAALGYNPLFICFAACAGAMSIGHVNDSGFWIMVSRCGFTTKGGLKSITLTEFVMSLVILAECLVFGAIFR